VQLIPLLSPDVELVNPSEGAENVLVASVNFCAGLRGTEKEIHQEEAHTWTLQDGKVVRLEWGRDLDTALEAAGLSE